MRKMRTYTKEEKQQIIDEVLATKNMAAVARKNKIPAATVQTWFRSRKVKPKAAESQDNYKSLKKSYDDVLLENKILKDLLKKTVQVLG